MSNEKSLRSQVIRLAHEHPEFRKDLLPLVTKKAGIIQRGTLTPEALALVDAAHEMKLALAAAYPAFLKQWAKSDMYMRDWNRATWALIEMGVAGFGTNERAINKVAAEDDVSKEKDTKVK